MDLSLNQEQELIKISAKEFLLKECPADLVRDLEKDETGFSLNLWKKMAQLGWMGLITPIEYEGNGGNFLDFAVLMEEMGRVCLPSWFFSTVALGAQAITFAGTEKQKKKLLPDICDGKSIVTIAMIEPDSCYDMAKIEMASTKSTDKAILDGVKLFVPDAHIADKIICVVKDGGEKNSNILLCIVDAKSEGISINPLKTISGDKLFEVKFNAVKVPSENILGEKSFSIMGFEKVLQKAAIAKCAEMVGGAQKVMEMSVEYAKMRVQFNQPIGSFQAIQHHCANMLTDLDCSRLVTYNAAWMISENLSCDKEIAMAKAFTSEAYVNITALGQQIHGGTGLIDEHDMQLYFRRAKAAALTLGNATYQRNLVAQEIGL